jgi:type II secretory pathway pseudopilin PulG
MHSEAQQPSRRGATLLEALLGIAVVAVIAGLAIPLARSIYAGSTAAETAAHQIARDLVRARILAVTHSSDAPDGIALVFLGAPDDYAQYVLRDLTRDADIPPVRTLAEGSHGATQVTCRSPGGARRFAFKSLGGVTMQNAAGTVVMSDPALTIVAQGDRYVINLTTATGLVEVQRQAP